MFRPEPVADDKRNVMREVALAYRRADRAGKRAGLSPPEYNALATTAAMETYLRLDPDAPPDRLAASAMVNRMIALAINADIEWFWRGPDA